MTKQAKQLLEHGLKDIYDAEQKFVDALGEMIENSTDKSLCDGFRRHREVTQNQVKRLEKAFGELGQEPERERCAGSDGLIKEYKTFVREESPDAQLHDAFAAGAGLKVEHYEIATYRNLVDLAEFCDLGGVARELKKNLAEEEQAAAELMSAAATLGAKLAGASTAAVAGRAVGGIVDQTREGTFRALGAARSIGTTARTRTSQAIKRAESRGRKVRAKGRAKPTTSRKKATRRKATAATTRKKATTRTRATSRRPAAKRTTTRRTSARRTSTRRRTSG